MFRLVAQRLVPAVTKAAIVQPTPVRVLPAISNIIRNSSTTVALTDEQKDQQWVEYFDNPELDYFDFCIGFKDLWQEDAIPEPVILQSALYACRRLNNLPIALRCLELVRIKCCDKKEIYDYIIQELGPTFDDLGLKTPEQLEIDQVTENFETDRL
ncbi:cytochrome c oxidase subunit 5A, mitochondrial-like [Styela clava]|uniref:cytochrome c oxidase subunit 5A, mitochondrial-like n=1 Tax=Styela clava TaxID=7725 RepID=UPI0019397235|nr:cytochrome c oxidase subunit 5A, mitochondrial-like [Styela clava]